MNILITGGAGFIGSNLSVFHLAKNDDVYVIDNLLTGMKENISDLEKNNHFHFIHEDVTSSNFKFQISNFDIIYHLASPASPIQYKKYPLETLLANSLGTYRLLEFLVKSKSKTFVLASTSEVYGDPEVHPQVETYWGNVNPVGIRSCYDESKRFAESISMTYFRKYNINLRIARIFNTYGPNMEKRDGRVISNFIMQALTNNPITLYGDGKQTRSFCYASDMINVLYILATTKNISGQIFNLGNPEETIIGELAKVIKNKTRSKSEIIHIKIDGDDPKRRKPDITRARTILKWEPKMDLSTGLDKTIKYFRDRFV